MCVNHAYFGITGCSLPFPLFCFSCLLFVCLLLLLLLLLFLFLFALCYAQHELLAVQADLDTARKVQINVVFQNEMHVPVNLNHQLTFQYTEQTLISSRLTKVMDCVCAWVAVVKRV